MRRVYCIEALDAGPLAYKIGVAADVSARVRQLQGANHALLQVVASFPCHNDTGMESMLHSMLSQYHIRGEWFRPDHFVRNVMLRCAAVFGPLTEEQNIMLCNASLACDGWLYRHLKGWSFDPLPSWLRAAA